MSETAKIRERVLEYCQGYGIDLGCGDDKLKSETIGVDLRPLPGVNFIGDATKRLNRWFLDQEFDYVYSSHFLEHLDNPIEALCEWVRILKDEGYLVLYLPHKEHYLEYNPEHKQELDQETVLAWLKSVGDFEIVVNEMDVGKDRYSFLIVAKKQIKEAA